MADKNTTTEPVDAARDDLDAAARAGAVLPAPFQTDAGDASTAAPETTEQRVRRWVAENLSHGRIARDPELWNEIQAGIPALVAIIDA